MRLNKLPTTHRFLFLTLSLALGGGLFLTACSGGSSGVGTANTQPTPATQANQPKAQATQPQAKTQAGPTAAASGKAQAPSSKASLDACSLLTKQEVEAAVGTQVLDPMPGGSGALVSCSYKDPKHSNFDVVGLSVLIGTDATDAKGAFDTGKANAGGVQAVTGLGDDAYWLETLSNLEVLKGKYDISVMVAPDIKGQSDAAKVMAAKVLGRLP